MGADELIFPFDEMGGGEDLDDSEGSVLGKGRETMLPSRGNPFAKGGRPFAAKSPAIASVAASGDGEPEPEDLTPEKVAAMFPSRHEDRTPAGKTPMGAKPSPAPTTSVAPTRPIAIGPRTPQVTPTPTPLKPAARRRPMMGRVELGEAPAMSEGMPPASDMSSETAMTATPAPAATLSPMPSLTPVSQPPAAAPEPSPAAPVVRDVGGQTSIAAPTVFTPSSVSLTHGRLVKDAMIPTPADPALVKMLVTDDKIAMLMMRIDAAEKAAIAASGGDAKVSQHYLDHVEAARHLLLGGRENFENAEREISEVEAMLETNRKVRQWSYTYGTGILIYDLVWLALLIVGVVYTPGIVRLATSDLITPGTVVAIWAAVLAGALGGVTGSIYNLWVHVAKEQDFDPQHMMWYITSPIMGTVIGVSVCLILVAGLLVFSQGGLNQNTTGFVAGLAWLGGFQQNVFYELVERAAEVVRKKKEEGDTRPPVTASPVGAQPPAAKK